MKKFILALGLVAVTGAVFLQCRHTSKNSVL